jgi:hypothetical protein
MSYRFYINIYCDFMKESGSRSFKNGGVGVGVVSFVYRLHSPGFDDLIFCLNRLFSRYRSCSSAELCP